jgi:hypothetical protein
MSIKDLREQAAAALDNQDWTEADVDHEERRVSMVFSVRLPGDLAEVLANEAAQQETNPSVVLRQLVETLRPVDQDAVVTLRLADIHRYIDQMARRAA